MFSSENSTPNSSSDTPCYKSYLSSPNDVPSKDIWYYGDLNEDDADQLLQNSEDGTFIVRRNGSGRYYMSYVTKHSYVQHSPIRQINACYFFDGTRYDTLADVVAGCPFAMIPLAREDEFGINQLDYLESKYLCIKTYERHEVDEMSANFGDVLSVCETDDAEWMQGRNETTGAVGLVPSSHLQALMIEVDDLNELPYFYDTVSTDMVQLNPIGAFLLRRSSKGENTYALLVKTQNDLVEKFLIIGTPERGFCVAGRPFPSVGHVVNRYCDRSISGGVRLTHAVCVDKASISFSQHDDENYRRRSDGSANPRSNIMTESQHSSASAGSAKPTISGGDMKTWAQKAMTRRVFRGTSIDTSMASTHIGASAMPSPSMTVSTAATAPDDAIITSIDHYEDDDETTVVATTNALRKSREEKPWKECWVTLCDVSSGSSQLVVYDSPTGSKRRQHTVELSTSTVFWLDESVFGRDGCVYVSPVYATGQPAIYLCFRPTTLFLLWIRLLRHRSISQEVIPPAMSRSMCGEPTSQMSLLFVDIDKYRSDSLKNESVYSANVLLNGVKMCATGANAPAANRPANELPVVVVDSRFILPCIPSCSNTIQLAVVAHPAVGKKGRACAVSALYSLNDSPTSPSTRLSSSSSSPNLILNSQLSVVDGSGFSFRAHRKRFVVLSIDRYSPLIEALSNYPSELLRWPSQALPQPHKSFLYSCLSYLYVSDPQMMIKVIGRIIRDVLSTSTAEDVFRKDSAATGCVTACLRHLMKAQLDEFLHENSQMTHALKQQTNNTNNSPSLDVAVDALVEFVDSLLGSAPLAARLLATVAKCARNRFPGEQHLVKRTLSALLILRVLNPIILTTGNGSAAGQLAKAVQTCANVAASRASSDDATVATTSSSAATMRRMFDRIIMMSEQDEMEAESQSYNRVDLNCEWLACVAHLISHSLVLKQQTESPEEAMNALPFAVVDLIRLHQ